MQTLLLSRRERGVRVLAMGQRPLLGTVLLKGTKLLAQFTDRGVVTVDDQ